MQASSTHWYILSSLSTNHENQQPTGQGNAEVQVNKLVQFHEKFLSVEVHVTCVCTYVYMCKYMMVEVGKMTDLSEIRNMIVASKHRSEIIHPM